MTFTVSGQALGRLVSPIDSRDNQFLARSRFALERAEPEKRRKDWYTDNTRHYDQGNVGQCTMYSAAHLISAGPVTQRPYAYEGHNPPFNTIQAYCRAQQFDKIDYGFSSPTYCQDNRRGDNGATMRSAAKVLKEMGYITAYWWMRTIDEVLVYLTNEGPVWMGTYWFMRMNSPNEQGFLLPEGSIEGGHAYILDDINWDKEYVWMMNTWGRGWAHENKAKISFAALRRLLDFDGEAIAINEIRRPS